MTTDTPGIDLAATVANLEPEHQAKVEAFIEKIITPPPAPEVLTADEIVAAYTELDDQAKVRITREIHRVERRAERARQRHAND